MSQLRLTPPLKKLVGVFVFWALRGTNPPAMIGGEVNFTHTQRGLNRMLYTDKLDLPTYYTELITGVLRFLEVVDEAGYDGASTQAIIRESTQYYANGGSMNTVLWSLYDSGYVFGWKVVIDGHYQHVWSIRDQHGVSEDRIYGG